jgi:[calcium/calmodulin-dependent protein kinase] kinase
MTKEVTDRMLAFQSDPSLPALLSSTSSVSADPEGDFLGNPGVVGRSLVIDTTDSLTPPALTKEPISGFPLEAQDVPEGAVRVKLDNAADLPPSRGKFGTWRASRSHPDDDCDDGDDSDSDEGLIMAKPKKKPPTPTESRSGSLPRDAQAHQTHRVDRLIGNARRRDTNCSVGSTETAKKLVVDSD